MVTAEQLERTRRLSLELAGIELLDRHRELLSRRSRRSGMRDTIEWDRLLTAAEAGDAAARERLIGLITTSFTAFFRHPRQFEIATARLRRTVELRGHARAWSAAAATGEEPWSLAMAVREAFTEEGPPVSILATDINPGTLDVARKGEYSGTAVAALPPDRRTRWLEPTGDGRWRVSESLRRLVEFQSLNLVEATWAAAGPFDVIFCRNVVMYLADRHREAVLERLVSRLAPDGLLMLDPTEHPGRAACLSSTGEPGVYSPRPAPPVKGTARHGRPLGSH